MSFIIHELLFGYLQTLLSLWLPIKSVVLKNIQTPGGNFTEDPLRYWSLIMPVRGRYFCCEGEVLLLSATKCYPYKGWPRKLSAISPTRNVVCIYAHMPMHTVPWVPEVFLACGGNFQCWPKADTFSATSGKEARKNLWYGGVLFTVPVDLWTFLLGYIYIKSPTVIIWTGTWRNVQRLTLSLEKQAWV